MNYVFIPQRKGIEPQWINVSKLSRTGMTIETAVPVAIRTPGQYKKGSTYRIKIADRSGRMIQSIEQKVDWSGMLKFTIDPKGAKGAFVC